MYAWAVIISLDDDLIPYHSVRFVLDRSGNVARIAQPLARLIIVSFDDCVIEKIWRSEPISSQTCCMVLARLPTIIYDDRKKKHIFVLFLFLGEHVHLVKLNLHDLLQAVSASHDLSHDFLKLSDFGHVAWHVGLKVSEFPVLLPRHFFFFFFFARDHLLLLHHWMTANCDHGDPATAKCRNVKIVIVTCTLLWCNWVTYVLAPYFFFKFGFVPYHAGEKYTMLS